MSRQKRDNGKKNTEKAFNPKIEEFKNYLKDIYGEAEPETYHLTTPDKVFGFMFYQANRVKKINKKNSGKFDKADFELTMAYTEDDSRDVIGEQAINQYIYMRHSQICGRAIRCWINQVQKRGSNDC